jgi:hypothetical protein
MMAAAALLRARVVVNLLGKVLVVALEVHSRVGSGF